MAESLLIVVAGRPPNLANLRLGWVNRYRVCASRKALVRMLARLALVRARSSPVSSPCMLRATVYIAGRQLDPDNAVASLKADIDGLVAAGVLVEDSPTWLRLEVQQVRAPRREQRVEYHVTPLTASPAGGGRGQRPPAQEVVLQDPGSGIGPRSGERLGEAGARGRRCHQCGAVLAEPVRPSGWPRRFCGSACRSRAYLRLSRRLPVDLPKQRLSGRRPLGAPRP